MIVVVFDTNVIISAIFWPRSTARRALSGLARRCYAAAMSRELLDEYADVAARFRERFPRINPAGALGWLQAKCLWVELAPLGKRRRRDLKGDPVLAAALAARARYLVASDRDLLVLEKPFGIEIVSPAEFPSRTELKSQEVINSPSVFVRSRREHHAPVRPVELAGAGPIFRLNVVCE